MTRPEVPLPGPTTKRRLVLALHHAMARTGADTAFVRARQPDGAMILVYHGIVRDDEAGWIDPRYSIPERAFEAQMRFLARRRRVWSIGQLLETVARGEPIAAGTVVVTFDDGYKSVLDVGAPILERYDIPALLYLATGYVSRQESQFADVLYGAFKQRTRNVLALSDGTLGPVRLSDPSMIQRTYTALEARLLVSSAAQRTELLAEIVERLRPLQPPPRLTLTWDEVARLHRVWPRVELGAHTRDHVDLSACTFETARREVEASVDDVKRALGSAPAHFAYPFGRSGLAARAAVAGAALRSAAVTEPAALVRKGADPLALPRLSAPRDMSLFSFLTSGAYPGLPLALIGRA